MSIVSLEFLIFVIVVLFLYYVLPKKVRWNVLLVASSIYFLAASGVILFFVFLAISFINYIVGIRITKLLEKEKIFQAKLYYIMTVLADVITLIIYKDSDFLHTQLIAPIGISYFILIMIGYLTDIYWGKFYAERNFLKFTLFTSYFPQLSSGPFVKYNEMKSELFEAKAFDFERMVFGVERILWGFFKKLVLAERLAVIVNTIYGDYQVYNGVYIWVAVIAFTFQLYCDFSGAMDIILGVSECFGIKLPENFNTPFYSLSIQEFWRRWHITLGTWLREYVFYPIQRSRFFSKLRKWCKKNWGKSYEKKCNLPLYLGLFVTWFLIGFWHGGKLNYIWGSGLYYWLLITLGELMNPIFKKLITVLQINTECWSWKLFQRIRTFMLFTFGLSFFRAKSLKQGIELWKASSHSKNIWILFDSSLYNLGLDRQDFWVLIWALLVLLVVEHYKTKFDIRSKLAEQNYVFRLVVILALIFGIIILGKYGANYVASAFIYEQF